VMRCRAVLSGRPIVDESHSYLHCIPAVSRRRLCEQVVGQDEQQPRKERESRVLQRADHAVVDVDQVELTAGTTSDAEEDSGMEEQDLLELDNIVLMESPNADVTGWT